MFIFKHEQPRVEGRPLLSIAAINKEACQSKQKPCEKIEERISDFSEADRDE